MNTQYPEDEFDEAGKLYPVGAYRQAPSKWKAVVPFLLVLVFAPILAWATVSLLTAGTTTEQAAQQSTQATQAKQQETAEKETTQKVEETAKPEEKPAEETKPVEKKPAEEKPAEQANKAAAVQVLNGTGVNGLAGGAVGKLQAAGFSNLAPDNAVGWQTEVSTVYFKPGNEATAKEVATTLGIGNVLESDQSTGDVTVVLKGDYQP